MKHAFLASICTVALVCGAGTARAEALPQDEGAAAAQPAAAPDAGQEDENSGGLTDIIVTAQRRSESVQDSSLAISVVDPAQLERANLTQAEGLSRLVPNVSIGSHTYSRIYLRGVGDNNANGFAQSAVAVNVDGVHIARTSQYGGSFYDVARVEVLKGPQGTLYGRNASAGVINVITNAPTQEFGGHFSANVGNFDFVNLEGALNVPLGPTLAARVAFNIVDRDGYLADGYNDQEQQSGRLRVLWEPSADVTLALKADYTHTGGKGQAPVVLPTPPGQDPWMAPSGAVERSYQIASNSPQIPGADAFVDNKYGSVSAELNWNLGFAELTVIPAYRWQDFSFYGSPTGVLNFREADTVKQTSLETRLSRDTSSFKWVAGFYYFREVTELDAIIYQGSRAGAATGLSNIYTPYRAPTKAIAFFADGNLSLTDNLRVLAGIRYTDETRGLFGTTTTFSTIASVPACPASIERPEPRFAFCLRGTADNEVKNDAVTWRAGVEYDVGADSMLYFTANRGFKSGGIFSGAAPGNDYKPEFLTSYDGGIRNRFFGNTLQLNLEGFYWDYTDYQFSFINFDVRGVSALVTRNAGKARIYGGNVDAIWKAGSNDTLRLTVEYLNAKFSEFSYTTPLASDTSRLCPSQGIVGTAQFPGGSPQNLFGYDCSGLALPRAPKWAIQGGWTHEFQLADGAKVVADVDAQYNSSYKLDVTYVPFMKQDPFALVNAQLAYHAPDDRWSLAAWVQNITNEAVYTDARRLGATNFALADIRPPRTYGIRMNYNF